MQRRTGISKPCNTSLAAYRRNTCKALSTPQRSTASSQFSSGSTGGTKCGCLSALSRVAQNGHMEVLKWLCAKSPRYFGYRFKFANLNLLRDAAGSERLELVQWMLNVGKDSKRCIGPAVDAQPKTVTLLSK